jgi:hypothetical protein
VFSTTTTDADPGNGVLRFNNADQSATTQIFIDLLDNDGNTVTTWLDSFDDGTGTVEGHLYVLKYSSSGVISGQIFTISAVTTATGYRKITVAGVQELGTAEPFANSDVIYVEFVRAGDLGPTGPDGPPGPTGPTGPTGSVAGSSTWVQYNNGGVFDASSLFTFDESTGQLNVPGRTRFAAGSATADSWPKFAVGPLLTTAEDGAVELDDNCFYMTTDAGNRGVVPIEHIIRADAAETLTSQTGAQAIFDSPTNGQITLETGVYQFDALIALTSMSGTTGNATFDFGGTATMGAFLWHGFGRDVAADAATGNLSGSYSVDATLVAAPLVTTGTATAAFFKLEGTLEVTAGGTVIPRILLQTAAAAVVSIGSYFRIRRLGSTSMVSVGQWD